MAIYFSGELGLGNLLIQTANEGWKLDIYGCEHLGIGWTWRGTVYSFYWQYHTGCRLIERRRKGQALETAWTNGREGDFPQGLPVKEAA